MPVIIRNIMAKINKTATMTVLVLSLGLLTACDMYAPPVISTQRVGLDTGQMVQGWPTVSVDQALVRMVAEEYHRYGDGPLEILVTYDPRSARNTAMHASDAAAHISRLFSHEGITAVKSEIMPIHAQGQVSQTYMQFASIEARAPLDCGLLPGMEDRETRPLGAEYGYGCTVETLLSRQIARPADLKGREGPGTGDAHRQGVMADRYHRAAAFPPLP